jgi:hypothetical protein
MGRDKLSSIANAPIGTDTVTASPNNGDSNLIERRTYFRDTGTATAQVGKNAFLSINHTTSVQTVNTIQDRALWISHSTPSGSYSCYGIEGLQIEMDINGTPTFTGSPDAEAMPLSLQMADTHQGNLAAPTGFGAGLLRGSYFREATGGCWTSPTALITIEYENLSAVAGNGQQVAIFQGKPRDLNGPGTNIPVIVFNAKTPGVTRFSSNTGFNSEDFGTNANDFNYLSAGSMPSSGKAKFNGPVILPDYTPASASDTGIAGSIAWDQNFMYRCTATNTWKRAAISTW